MDHDDKFLTMQWPSRPDIQIQYDLIDPQGVLVLSVPASQQPRRLSEQQRDQIFSLHCEQLTLRSSDPLRGDGIILVDYRQRTLRRQGDYIWHSGDWAEVMDRSRHFMNSVESYYLAVEALADAIHRKSVGEGFASLVRQANECEQLSFLWAESIFFAADPESHEALIAWTHREMDERINQLPPTTGNWLAALFRWGACGGQSPSAGFDYLVCDVTIDEVSVVKRFAESPHYHIAALRLLVAYRPLWHAYTTLQQCAPSRLSHLSRRSVPNADTAPFILRISSMLANKRFPIGSTERPIPTPLRRWPRHRAGDPSSEQHGLTELTTLKTSRCIRVHKVHGVHASYTN